MKAAIVQKMECLHLHVNHESDMPRDRDVVIFCANEHGLKLYEYCCTHGISVRGFIDLQKTTLDNSVPVFGMAELKNLVTQGTNLLISTRGYQEHISVLEAAEFSGIYIAHPFAQFLLASATTQHQLKQGQIYDAMVTSAPSPQHDVDIFAGDWMSELPLPGVKSGWNKLFVDDPRLKWVSDVCHGLAGSDILELGPYEGGHTFALEKAYGAASVTAVEANPRAFLRCLIAKNLLDMKNSRFLLGDFTEYLKNTDKSYDLIFASGVLYHMTKPAELLELISGKARRVFLWTHVYDEALISANKQINFRFDYTRTRESQVRGYSFNE